MPTWKVKDKANDIFQSIEEQAKSLAEDINLIILSLHHTGLSYINLDLKIKENILPLMGDKLNNSKFISGVGFATLSDIEKPQYKSWQVLWMYRQEHIKTPGWIVFNKTSQPRLDYQTFAWFAKAKESERGYLHGPYVDYICNTHYTLTYLYPIYLKNNFIGVAAIDLLVGHLEHEIRQVIAKSTSKIVMTTATKRVVFSNHPKYRVGELAILKKTQQFAISDYFTLWAVTDDYGA